MDPSAPVTLVPGWTGTWDQLVSIVWATTYADVASAALLTYDTILTIGQESRLVWKGRWGFPTFVYFVTRYGNTLQSILNLVANMDWNLDMDACYTWQLFSNWGIPAVMLVAEATLALRVVALYENEIKVKVFVWLWYLGSIVSTLTMMGLTLEGSSAVPSPAPPTLGCQIDGPMTYWWTIYIPSLIFEATVALMTLIRAIQHKRIMELKSTPLLYVLIRDQFFYFFVVFALNLVNLLVTLLAPSLYLAWTPQLTISISSIIAVRLFLNLREVAYVKESTQVDQSRSIGLHVLPSKASTGRTTLSAGSRSTGERWFGDQDGVERAEDDKEFA